MSLLLLLAMFEVKEAKNATGLQNSCSFDGYDLPCLWSDNLATSRGNESIHNGVLNGFKWNVKSSWSHKKVISGKFKSLTQEENLLLVIFVHFEAIRRFEKMNQTRHYEQFFAIDLSNHSILSNQFEITKPDLGKEVDELSQQINHHTPLMVRYGKFYLPRLEIQKESCISFRLRVIYRLLSESDSLLLWATNGVSNSSHLLWSVFGPVPVPTTWTSYSIGILPGIYNLFFNGSIYLKSRKSQLMFVYELNDIKVASNYCKSRDSRNNFLVPHGVLNISPSPFSDWKCAWASFVEFGAPLQGVSLSLEANTAPSINATITHISRSGINVCIKKISADEIGWKHHIYLKWFVHLRSGVSSMTINENLVTSTFKLPTLPDEGQNDKVLKESEIKRIFFDKNSMGYDVCSLSQFQCASFRCISLKFRCDGNQDCMGGEDELSCNNFQYNSAFIEFFSVGMVFVMFIAVARCWFKRAAFVIQNIEINPLASSSTNFAVERENRSVFCKNQEPQQVIVPVENTYV